MRAVRRKVPLRLRTRTCLACGYDGPSLQLRRGRSAAFCPCCGQNLSARPPRSYAEMEGLKTRRRLRIALRRKQRSRPRKVRRAHPLTRPLAHLIRFFKTLIGLGPSAR